MLTTLGTDIRAVAQGNAPINTFVRDARGVFVTLYAGYNATSLFTKEAYVEFRRRKGDFLLNPWAGRR